MGNMSALEDTLSEPMEENSVIADQSKPTEKTMEPTVKSKKLTLKSYRQKLQTIQARIKYREKAIKSLRNHLKKGTFPKRFKSLRPYPKMETPESQAIVNAACEQVHCVILDQMALEEEIKLIQDQNSYQAMKEEREDKRSQIPRKPKKLTVAQLMQELTDLQSKYTELCSKLDTQEYKIKDMNQL